MIDCMLAVTDIFLWVCEGASPPALSEGEGDLLSGCRQGAYEGASHPALVRPMAHEDNGSG